MAYLSALFFFSSFLGSFLTFFSFCPIDSCCFCEFEVCSISGLMCSGPKFDGYQSRLASNAFFMTIDAKTEAAVRAAFAAGTTRYSALQAKFPYIGRGSLCRIINDESVQEAKTHDSLVVEARLKTRRLNREETVCELITHCGSTFYVRRNTADITQLDEIFGIHIGQFSKLEDGD